jgi:hypothetical protein
MLITNTLNFLLIESLELWNDVIATCFDNDYHVSAVHDPYSTRYLFFAALFFYAELLERGLTLIQYILKLNGRRQFIIVLLSETISWKVWTCILF